MQITWGNDYFEMKNGRKAPIVMDTARLINGHALVIGASGVGKSHTFRDIVEQAARSNKKIRIHVMDVHGDLEIPAASMVVFSEASEFGLNPFVVNPDPHYGGVRKCINTFIRVINQSSVSALGEQQVNVIRELLIDVFRDFGFDVKDSSTWSLNEYESRLLSGGNDNRLYLEVPIAEKDAVKAYGARWDGDKKHWWIATQNYKGDITKWRPAYKPRTYPTLADLVEYTDSVYKQRFLGSDQKALKALAVVNKAAKALQKKRMEMARNMHYTGMNAEMEEELLAAKDKAKEAYEVYIDSIQTGHELESLLKYDSPELLKGVLNRLRNFDSTGVFKATTPNFDPNVPVWRYHLKALAKEEKKMLVLFKLQEIFNGAVQRGERNDVLDIIVLDELGTYTSNADKDGGEGIIGVIAREARKFGLALWAATQSPDQVPNDLLTSVSTIAILGMHSKFWKASVNTLDIDMKLLQWVQPWESIAVQMKEKGSVRTRWRWVQLEKKTGV